MFEMKKGLASLAIAGSLFGATIAGVGAAPPDTVQPGGAARVGGCGGASC